MGDVLGKMFVDPDLLEDTFAGFIQVSFLGLVYGYVLAKASTMISDGSELLLLVPSMKGVVGSIVLPILGAVPDGAIVLFSGLGPNAEEQVAVGVGALAGSTIMLLTVPWALSIIGGRVDIVDGHARYRKPRGAQFFQKLTKGFSLTETGVEPQDSVATNGLIMLATAAAYVIIQVPATFLGCDFQRGKCDKLGERWYAFTGMVVSFVAFVAYMVYQWRSGSNDDIVDEKITQNVVKGVVSLSAVFRDHALRPNEGDGLLSKDDKMFEGVCRRFFNDVDDNKNGTIEPEELRVLIYNKMRLKLTEEEFNKLLHDMDKDKDNSITFSEFKAAMHLLLIKKNPRRVSVTVHTADPAGYGAVEPDDEDEEEEPDMPDNIADLPPEQQLRRVIMLSCKLMGIGTALVLLFSDPMVAVMSSLGKRAGIPLFYVSFILAPLASNLAEVVAAYSYSKKKTSKSITIAFETLHGAGSMNNTFCLGIFFCLIFFKGLAWQYTAETLAILAVEFAIALFSLKKVHTVGTALMILALYPLSLAFVYILEAVGLN